VAWFSINLYNSKSLVLITRLYKFIENIKNKGRYEAYDARYKNKNYKWKVTVIFLVERSPFVSIFRVI